MEIQLKCYLKIIYIIYSRLKVWGLKVAFIWSEIQKKSNIVKYYNSYTFFYLNLF